MKKQILTVIAVIVSLTSLAQAAQVNRPREVVAAFLKEANSANSAIANKLEQVREEESTGFCSDDCVIPKNLKASDIRMIVTGSEIYLGKLGFLTGSEEEIREPGYENWKMEVHVPAKSVHYGGRINSMKTVVFSCTLETEEYESPKSQIQCSLK